MAVLAGYSTTIEINGASTAFTGEAFTGSGAGPWTITTESKSVWNPATTPTFYDNAVAISSGDISSIDYLFGKVTFTGSKTGPITADGAYYPRTAVSECKAFEVEITRDPLDVTVFHATQKHRERILGLLDLRGMLSTFDPMVADLLSGPGSVTWQDILTGSTSKVISIYVGQTRYWRFWAKTKNLKISGERDGLVEGSVEFELDAHEAADGTAVTYSEA
jgi:hypothetical protein